MEIKRDKCIDGEFDFPLPERKANPTAEDKEKLQRLLKKYGQLDNDNN